MTMSRVPLGYDPSLPWLAQLLVRGWSWSTATRRRRFWAAPMYLHVLVYAVAMLFPPVASAAMGTAQTSLIALGVVDSYGVPLWKYTFTTDYGSVMDFGTRATLATLLQIEAGFFVAIGGFAIWLLTSAIKFEFVKFLVIPFSTMAQNYAGRILPGVALIAAMVAGLFVAFNVMRGNTVRAASQAVVAVCVALVGAAMLHSPISWVMSDNGPLISARNVAIGLGANTVASSQQAESYPNQLEGVLATEFVRQPLQMWNLSAVADDTPACAAAWSAGVLSGNQDRIKDGVAACGGPNSAQMKESADNPGAGQIGTGLMLLCFIGVFALFCIVLALHIIGEFFRAVANAFRLLWDAAVGVIPGVAQSNLVNTFVAMMFSAVAMFAYVTFAVFVGNLAQETARFAGSGLLGMFCALIVMVLALVATRRVSQGLKKSSDATTASILSGLGAPPVPEKTNILKEKSKAFLRDAGQIGTGVAAGAVGAKVVSHMPALAPGLQLAGTYLPHRRKLRHVSKGAARQQKAAAAAAKQQQKAQQKAAATATNNTAPATAAPAGPTPPNQAPTSGQAPNTAPISPAASGPAAATQTTSTASPSSTLTPGSPRTTTTVAPAPTSGSGTSPAPRGTAPATIPAPAPAGVAPPPTRADGTSPLSRPPVTSAAPPLPDLSPIDPAPPPAPGRAQPASNSGNDTSPSSGAAASPPPSPFEHPGAASRPRPTTTELTPMPPPTGDLGSAPPAPHEEDR